MVKELSDLCDTYLYSDCERNQRVAASRYLAQKAGYPDECSDFAKQIGMFKYIFRVPVVSRLLTQRRLSHLHDQGYDALMLNLEREVIGHTAFQIHDDDSLHIFSVERQEEYKGNNLGIYMVEKVLVLASGKGIRKVRLGKGNNEATNKIYIELCKRQRKLRIITSSGNWIKIY